MIENYSEKVIVLSFRVLGISTRNFFYLFFFFILTPNFYYSTIVFVHLPTF